MYNYNTLYLKIAFVFIFTIFTGHYTFSQSKIKGNREVQVQQTGVEAFKTISIGSDIEVILVKSIDASVTIEADSNLIPIINFQVKDSILNFQITQNVSRAKEFKVTIRYTEELNSIILNDDVDVEAENTIELPELSLTLNDDAKIEADIVTDKFTFHNNNDSNLKLFTNCILKVESKSASINVNENSNNILDINTENLFITAQNNAELNVEGFAYNLELKISESSSVKGKNLLSNVSKVTTSDKSSLALNVTEDITIDASGSSNIELYGEPKITITTLTNSAVIEKKEM